jgi:O-antigen/teichoic acid export membrane protein
MSSDHTRIIAKGAGITILGLIISKVLTYFYRIFIARFFGPEIYGLFSLGLAVIGFAGAFGELGLRGGIQRFIPEYVVKKDNSRLRGTILYSTKKDNSRLRGTILYSTVTVGLVNLFLMGVLILFAKSISNNIFHNPSLTDMLVVMSLSLPFAMMFNIIGFGFRGFKVLRYQVYTERIFLNLMNLGTILVFGLLGFGVIGIAWSYTISILLSLIFALYLFQKRVFPFLFSNIKASNVSKELLKYSFPLLLSGVVSGILVSNIDLAMIGYFKTVLDVGVYNAALPIAKILGIVGTSFTIIFVPITTELFFMNKIRELEIVYKTTVKWVFYINFPLLLIFLFYPHIIINYLFGEDYSAGSVSLIYLSIGTFISGLTGFLGFPMALFKKTKSIFYITVLSSFINVSLNWYLIPKIGITGAALASFISIIIQFCLYFYFSYKLIKMIPFSNSIIKIILASFASLIIFVVLSQFLLKFGHAKIILIFLLIGYFGLYSIFLLVSKTLDTEDVAMIKIVERKSGLKVEFLRNIIKKFI